MFSLTIGTGAITLFIGGRAGGRSAGIADMAEFSGAEGASAADRFSVARRVVARDITVTNVKAGVSMANVSRNVRLTAE
jgi:hypothetical protein